MDDCARMSCNQPAVALLTFAAPQAKAWLYDLVDPDPANGIILCRKHANGTVVPMSWQLVDARDPAWPGPVALAAEQPEDQPAPVAGMPGDRLASLPSDGAGLADDFAALGDLPMSPRPYTAPRETREALNGAGGTPPAEHFAEVEGRAETPKSDDASLFELSMADLPAVTPHPGYG